MESVWTLMMLKTCKSKIMEIQNSTDMKKKSNNKWKTQQKEFQLLLGTKAYPGEKYAI